MEKPQTETTASLPIAANGEVTLQDETRISFTAWTPVIGDILGNALLVESASGPRIATLTGEGTLEITGNDDTELFWNYRVTLSPAVPELDSESFIALSNVLVQDKDGFVRIPAAQVRKISWKQ